MGRRDTEIVGRANLALTHLRRGREGDRAAAESLLRLAWAEAEGMRLPEAEQIWAIQRAHGLPE